MRKGNLVLLLAVIVSAVGVGARSQSANSLDPLKVSPDTHKLLFENQLLRVIEAQVPTGATEPPHRHPPGITVCLTDYLVEAATLPDNEVTRSAGTFGTVGWSVAAAHEVKNIGKTKSHAIRIELK